MRGKIFLMLIGSALGGITAYLMTKRNEELKAKIAVLQEKVRSAELSDKVKNSLEEVLNKLNKVTNEKVSSPTYSNEDKEKILREVEEKVEKLEEILKKEQ